METRAGRPMPGGGAEQSCRGTLEREVLGKVRKTNGDWGAGKQPLGWGVQKVQHERLYRPNCSRGQKRGFTVTSVQKKGVGRNAAT